VEETKGGPEKRCDYSGRGLDYRATGRQRCRNSSGGIGFCRLCKLGVDNPLRGEGGVRRFLSVPENPRKDGGGGKKPLDMGRHRGDESTVCGRTRRGESPSTTDGQRKLWDWSREC